MTKTRKTYIITGIVLLLSVSTLMFYPDIREMISCNKVTIVNELIRGSVQQDSTGKKYAFRSVRATLTNNECKSLALQLYFTNHYIDSIFQVFLLPDTFMPDQQLDSATESLSKELQVITTMELAQPTLFRKIIKPGEQFTINVGLFFNPNITDTMGISRAEYFIEIPGNKKNLPDPIAQLNTTSNIYATIVLKVSLTNPFHPDLKPYSATITCGILTKP